MISLKVFLIVKSVKKFISFGNWLRLMIKLGR